MGNIYYIILTYIYQKFFFIEFETLHLFNKFTALMDDCKRKKDKKTGVEKKNKKKNRNKNRK